MTQHPLLLFGILALFLSCRHHPSTNHKIAQTTGIAVDTFPQRIHPSDSIGIITTPCVIMIDPTKEKRKQLKKDNGEENFYAIADDNQFYIGTASIYMDAIHFKTIGCQSSGTLKFKTAAGNEVKMNLAKYGWAILLFNGKDTPIEADITSFKEQFEQYMRP